jgi:hypothetical protein
MIQETDAGVEMEASGSSSRASAVGTVNWGTATLVGVFAGLLYGGSREAGASVVSGSSTLPAALALLPRVVSVFRGALDSAYCSLLLRVGSCRCTNAQLGVSWMNCPGIDVLHHIVSVEFAHSLILVQSV